MYNIVGVALAAQARRAYEEGVKHAETHCWNCDGETKPLKERDVDDLCPHCGEEPVPF